MNFLATKAAAMMQFCNLGKKSQMLYRSVKLTVVNNQTHRLNCEFYLAQLDAMCLCDAGRRGTCWFETEGDSDCEKAVMNQHELYMHLLSWQLLTAIRDLGTVFRCFLLSGRSKVCYVCKSALQRIPLTWKCSTKRKLQPRLGAALKDKDLVQISAF